MAIGFLSMIDYEFSMMDKIIEPPDEVEPGEEILAPDIPENLQKLYTLWIETGRAAGKVINDLQWGGASPDAYAKAQELKAKTALLNGIFWIAVQDELHLWGRRYNLAVRKGFKVVKCKAPDVPDFFRFLGGLGGGE